VKFAVERKNRLDSRPHTWIGPNVRDMISEILPGALRMAAFHTTMRGGLSRRIVHPYPEPVAEGAPPAPWNAGGPG